jgi:hypothetical protein
MTDSENDRFSKRGPHYADLVSVDIPLEHDFKQSHSHWQAYRRGHFRSRFLVSELMALGGESIGNVSRIVSRFSLIALIVLLILLLLVLMGNINQEGATTQGLHREIIVIAVSIGIFFIVFFFSSVSPRIEVLPFAGFIAGRKAPRMFDLAVHLRPNWRRVYEVYVLNRLIVRNAEINRIRVIWLGDGQIQFGCGVKGVSAENQDGFLYLIRWAKVATIYDADDLKNLQIEKTHRHYAEALASVQGIVPTGWAPESLRVRLKQTSDLRDAEPDELVIPKKKFFGTGKGDLTWEGFLNECWRHKLAADHEAQHGGGDAAVTVLPKHAADTMVREAVEEQAEGVVEPRHAGKRAASSRSRGV